MTSAPAISLPEPHDGQCKILAERRRFNVLECGRRWGKTMGGLGIVCETALDGWPAAWFTPSYKYFSEAWDELCWRLHGIIESKDKAAGRIKLKTGGVIDVWSLHDNPNAGRGRMYKVVVVDEAAIMRRLKFVWDNAIRPTLTDLKGDAWFLSTPSGYNDFHEMFELGQSGDPNWVSWRMGTITNPHISPDEIEAAKAELPEVVFEQEYLGVPAPDGGNPFGIDHIENCVLSEAEVQEGSGQAISWGVDLAKSQDWTVCIGLGDDGCVTDFDRWQRVPWRETAERVARHLGTDDALVDSTGVGDPIVESLQRDHDCTGVEGYQFTGPSKQKLMEGLAYAIQNRAVSFPEGDITRELRTFRYEVGPGGRVKYSAPEGLFDDCVMALALAVESLRQKVPVGAYSWGAGARRVDPEMQMQDGEGVNTMFQRRRQDPDFGFGEGRRRWR